MKKNKLKDKAVVIIPAYNEDNVLSIVNSVLEFDVDVVLIDDGSEKKIKKINDPLVKQFWNEKNLGKGASLRKGIGYILSSGDYDFVLFMDADGEHDPEYIPLFVDKLNNYDVVLSQRIKHRNLFRRSVNFFMLFWINLLGVKLRDPSSGFIGVRADILKKYVLKSKRYEFELEFILESLRLELNICQVEIDVEYGYSKNLRFLDLIKVNHCFDSWFLHHRHFFRKKLNYFVYLFLFFSTIIGKIVSEIILFVFRP